MKLTKESFDVITVGDVFTDIVMTGFDAWPSPGEEAFARQLRREIGGGAAITACGLARLGARVSTLAMVGHEDGQWFVDRVKDIGVSPSLIRFDLTEPTGLTISVSTSADRTFFTYMGANRGLADLLRGEQTLKDLAAARHVHFACPIDPGLLSKLAEPLRAAGCRISIDVGWQARWLADEDSISALRVVDLFLPNQREAELITGMTAPEPALRQFADMGLRRVALKLGEHGSMALWDGEISYCPPHRVSPVDTTGAGDCFDAGFIFAWLQNHTPQECLRLANICGALSTESLGGIAAFPSRQRVDALL